MKINNEEFQLYLLDTIETIQERIALQHNTIPEYLTFNPSLKINREQNVNFNVTFIINEIIDQARQNNNIFPDIDIKNITRNDAETFFISYFENKQLIPYIENLTTIDNPMYVWERRHIFKKKFENALKKLKHKVENFTQLAKNFQKIIPVQSTIFEVSQIQFTVKFSTNLSIQTLSQLFNSFKITKYVPYANMNSFYKIFRDFNPNPEWLDLSTPNVIIVKVNGEIDINEPKPSKNLYGHFTDAGFTILHVGEGLYQVVATMNCNIGIKNVSKEEFLNRVLQSFPILNRESIVSTEEVSTVGYALYPKQSLYIPIWQELTMNNDYFNNIVAINEIVRTSKIKQNVYMHVKNFSDIIAIVMKETIRPNMYDMKNVGELYIRARIKASNFSEGMKYQEILGRLITIYNNESSLILEQYREYIPNFLKEEQIKIQNHPRIEKISLRSIAPELFLANYSRKCLNQPTIIDGIMSYYKDPNSNRNFVDFDQSVENAETYERVHGKQVMIFPRWGESDSYAYICNHKSHPFPGLRENHLENKKKFQFIPCCYSKNQATRKGSRFRHYFDKEPLKPPKVSVNDVFTSTKILPPGMIGILPENINKLLNIIDPNPLLKFVRVGMNNTKSSLIESTMMGMDINRIQSMTSENKIRLINYTRDLLVNEKHAMAAKQELYNNSIDEIITYLRNENLLATDFVHVMEEFFNCNIFIFTSSEKEPNGNLVVPQHLHIYEKYIPSKPTVLIYQLISKNPENSCCELIARIPENKTKSLKNMIINFNPQEKLIKELWNIFRKLNRSFIYNQISPEIYIQDFQVHSQIIDTYGKCRLLNVFDKDNIITFVTNPLPPYAAKKATKIYRTKIKYIKEFVDKFNITCTKIRINKDGICREIDATMSNGFVLVTFLTHDTYMLQNVEISYEKEEYKDILTMNENIISKFNLNKKKAKLLFQYALFLLSKFIYDNNLNTPLNDDQLNDFILLKTTTINDYDYGNDLSSTFDMNSSFVQNNKLVVTSTEMIKRLLYMIHIYQSTRFKELCDYRNKTVIDNFYDDISDFYNDRDFHQLILNGSDAVLSFIKNFKTEFKITKILNFESTIPYFFYNTNLLNNTKIFLAENCDSLPVAVGLLKFWNNYGYNPRMENITPDENIENIRIFSYPNEIKMTQISGPNEQDAIPGVILGYKLQGVTRYTCLMPL